jgi:hypothetical protein
MNMVIELNNMQSNVHIMPSGVLVLDREHSERENNALCS